MAIFFKNRPAPSTPMAALIASATPSNLIPSLRDLAAGKKGKLRICRASPTSNETPWYEVLHYDPDTCQAKLKTPDGGILTPVLGIREAMVYHAEWH